MKRLSDIPFIEIEFAEGPYGRELCFEVRFGQIRKVWANGYDYGPASEVLEFWISSVGEERILERALSKADSDHMFDGGAA